MLRKDGKMVEESGCRWEEREGESACGRATAAEGERESWCNCVTAASASSQERWRRRREGGRDEEMKAGMKRPGKGQKRERESSGTG